MNFASRARICSEPLAVCAGTPRAGPPDAYIFEAGAETVPVYGARTLLGIVRLWIAAMT